VQQMAARVGIGPGQAAGVHDRGQVAAAVVAIADRAAGGVGQGQQPALGIVAKVQVAAAAFVGDAGQGDAIGAGKIGLVALGVEVLGDLAQVVEDKALLVGGGDGVDGAGSDDRLGQGRPDAGVGRVGAVALVNTRRLKNLFYLDLRD
jgi:hypothetical protein